MIFNKHLECVGKHAILSPSQSYWLRYSKEKVENMKAAEEARLYGTRLHAFAAEAISLGQKLPRNKYTLNQYVNDAIGFNLQPETVLYYSDNCFGTADTIGYNEKTHFLRIHDLKTGEIPADMTQLKVYAALFCLEYRIKPKDISIELRIYQFDGFTICEPESEEIDDIMAKIIFDDKVLKTDQLRG